MAAAKPRTTAVKPPPNLTEHGREEWRRLAPAAKRVGTLTTATSRSFELLCETLATERMAREIVATAGITVSTGRGGVKPHPACRTMEAARVQAAPLLKLFRLEPADPKTAGGRPPVNQTKGKSPWRGVLPN